MDTETDRDRPGPKRLRILDWIPKVEYCPECADQIVWYERIAVGDALDDMPNRRPPETATRQRFRRCCNCAAAMWARRG